MSAFVTITTANPALVNWPAHGFSAGQAIYFAFEWPIGTLPAGVTPGILYYVLASGLTAGTFQFALAAGGTPVATTADGSGTIIGIATSSTLNTFIPPVDPSPGTKDKPVVKLKEADFGEGYNQTTRDGLNWIRSVVTLSWNDLLPNQASTLMAFFRGQGGDTPFWWTNRYDTQTRKWTCKDFDRSNDTPNKFTATLREDFSLLQ